MKVRINDKLVEAGDDWDSLSGVEKGMRVDELAKQHMIISPTAPPAYRGAVLPIQRTAEGKIKPDWGFLRTIPLGLYDAFKLPGDVAIGDQPVIDSQTGQYDPQFIDRTAAAAPALLSPAPGALSGRRSMAQTPTSRQLMDVGGEGFNQARAAEMQYRGGDVRGMVDDLQYQHLQQGIVGPLAEKPRATISNMSPKYASDSVPLENLLAHRKTLMDTAVNSADAQERMVAAQGVQAIDRLVESQGAIAAGSMAAPEAAEVLRQARANQAAGHRSNTLTGELDRHVSGLLPEAQLQAGASYSGRNLDNAIRQKAKALLMDRSNLAGFSDDEIASLTTVAMGTAPQNKVRLWANRLGGGGGLGQSVVSGGAGLGAGGTAFLSGVDPAVSAGIGYGASQASGWVGSALKALENMLSTRNVTKLDETVRQRSPLHEARMARQDPAASARGLDGSELTARDMAILQTLAPGLLSGPTEERRRLYELNPPSGRPMPKGFI